MIEDYSTIKEIAERWGTTPRWVQELCASGKVPGAVKFANAWAVPSDAEKPTDGRVTTGEYRGWRTKHSEKIKSEQENV